MKQIESLIPDKSQLIVHPVPKEEMAATDYSLTIDGQSIFTYRARVSANPINQVWSGYQRPLVQTEIASFASWDMAGPVEINIVSARPVESVRIRPRSAGIIPEVENNTIRFRLEKPGQYTVEVNGTHGALHLFANPPEDATPYARDPAVHYFGPGTHEAGLIRLKSNETLYLAAGAVVYGAIFAEKADHINVCGRGILDGSKFGRFDVDGLVCLVHCNHVRIEGITLRDPSAWTIIPIACQQVEILNVKLIGNWRYNTDGIDFVNCRHCRLEDSFIRSFDDSIALKGYEKWGPFIYPMQLVDGKFDGSFTIDGKTRRTFRELQLKFGLYACNGASIEDIRVRRCVIWNEWGRALEIGLETVADEISDILFEDCDIIHTAHVALDIQNGDRARCRNIVFRNIRVEFDDDMPPPKFQTQPNEIYVSDSDAHNNPHLIDLEIVHGYCEFDPERGHIEDIWFEDIEVTAWKVPPSHLRGLDAEHGVQRIKVEGLTINGSRISRVDESGFTLNEFARDVTIKS